MRLVEYLEKNGFSRQGWAREWGFQQSQVSRWASGKQEPKLREALRLLHATGGQVALEDMLTPK